MYLSIIVPVYNTKPEYIDECLRSVNENVIGVDYEVIIVNDGTTDLDTLNKLDSLRINYHIIDQCNMGLPSARNIGISASKGEYILPLDSDDLIHHDFHNFLQELRMHSYADVIYGNMIVFGDVNNEVLTRSEFSKVDLIKNNQLPVCSIFKKNVWQELNGYDASYITVEDWDFWIRCKINNYRFQKIEKFVLCYRTILDGKSLFQQTSNLINEYHGNTLKKISLYQLTVDEIGNDFYDKFFNILRRKKRKFIYLFLYIVAPNFFEKFLKSKRFW